MYWWWFCWNISVDFLFQSIKSLAHICVSPNNHAYLVPIPCPLVPISAIRDWKPSGLNHYKIDDQNKCPLTKGCKWTEPSSVSVEDAAKRKYEFCIIWWKGIFFTDRCSFRKEVYMGCYFIFEVGWEIGRLTVDLTISCAIYTSCFNQSRCRGSQSQDLGELLNHGLFQSLMTKNISWKSLEWSRNEIQ